MSGVLPTLFFPKKFHKNLSNLLKMTEDGPIGPKRALVEDRRPPLDSSHRLTASLDKFHLLIGVTGSVATIKLEELIADLRKKYEETELVIKVSVSF